MFIEILKLIAGLIILYFGAEGMVQGSKRLAIALGIHPLVIGLTIVAFGTSMPELVVSLTAAYQGSPSIALGNIVGSNIANMSIILGLAAIISPLKVEDRTIRIEVPVTIFSGILLYFFCGSLNISLFQGVILVLAFVSFFIIAIVPEITKTWRVLPEELSIDMNNAVSKDEIAEARAGQTFLTDSLLIALGIASLVLGAQWTVSSAVDIAIFIGASEAAIGSTIVAFGTSLPEMATSLVAARKGESDISVGNVLGSNLFNTLIVAGVPTMVMGYFPIEREVLIFHFPIMIGLSIGLLPLLRSGGQIDRREGILLLLTYVFYFIVVVNKNPISELIWG
ncbi:MAG TPA: calcium/sodium antiporter [candidate division Zixibacteria bacterium]|nr:calcium/sodium antiporter [candidate division Zixibacteria bacterium]